MSQTLQLASPYLLMIFNAIAAKPTFNDVDNITMRFADGSFAPFVDPNDPTHKSIGDAGDPFPGTSGNTAFTLPARRRSSGAVR